MIDQVPKEEVPENRILCLAELSDSEIFFDTSSVIPGRPMKTRRQRILEQISFETECHNIYDPYFTSEEEDGGSASKESNLSRSARDVSRKRTERRRKANAPHSSSYSLHSLHSSLDSESFISSVQQHQKDQVVPLKRITPPKKNGESCCNDDDEV
jgi:hypothetical protein